MKNKKGILYTVEEKMKVLNVAEVGANQKELEIFLDECQKYYHERKDLK